MDINPYVVLGSAVVGLLVGLTGAGGGALMTPMLILLFNVKPAAAISSDLVAAVVMRPVGSLVHMHRGTVNYRLVGWMCAGSVPMAFLGAYLLHLLGAVPVSGAASQQNVEIALGAALLAGTAAMVLRSWLDHRSGQARTQSVAAVRVKPAATIAIGAVGGLVVGMTSVGSGSLMIVLLLFAYPVLAAGQLVGTDLTQAVPLTAAAALGALLFGHVQFGLTTAVIIGSVPAVLVGSLLSSRAPDRTSGRSSPSSSSPPGSSTRAWAPRPSAGPVPRAAGVRRLLAGQEQALARARAAAGDHRARGREPPRGGQRDRRAGGHGGRAGNERRRRRPAARHGSKRRCGGRPVSRAAGARPAAGA